MSSSGYRSDPEDGFTYRERETYLAGFHQADRLSPPHVAPVAPYHEDTAIFDSDVQQADEGVTDDPGDLEMPF